MRSSFSPEDRNCGHEQHHLAKHGPKLPEWGAPGQERNSFPKMASRNRLRIRGEEEDVKGKRTGYF